MNVGDILVIDLPPPKERVYVRVLRCHRRCPACRCPVDACIARKWPWPHTHTGEEDVVDVLRCGCDKRMRSWWFTVPEADVKIVRNLTVDMAARKIWTFWVRCRTTSVLAEFFPRDVARIIAALASR